MESCDDCSLLKNMPFFGKFDPDTTTNFLTVPDITNVNNAILEIYPYGRILFKEPVDFTGLDLDSYVSIEYNNVSVDSAMLPELNVSAEILLSSPLP